MECAGSEAATVLWIRLLPRFGFWSTHPKRCRAALAAAVQGLSAPKAEFFVACKLAAGEFGWALEHVFEAAINWCLFALRFASRSFAGGTPFAPSQD